STLLTHANAATLLAWADSTFTAEELAGVVAATSVCFDLSVFELFVPLSRGGTVVLLEQVWDVTTPAAAGATLLNTVPSAMAAVLRTGGLPASVQTVTLAGEALPSTVVAAVRAAGVARVLNLYGPTEDTTYSTGAPVEAEPTPPIGRP